jgi:hypothetical protein
LSYKGETASSLEGFLAVTGLNLVFAREWNDCGDLSIEFVISNG